MDSVVIIAPVISTLRSCDTGGGRDRERGKDSALLHRPHTCPEASGTEGGKHSLVGRIIRSLIRFVNELVDLALGSNFELTQLFLHRHPRLQERTQKQSYITPSH